MNNNDENIEIEGFMVSQSDFTHNVHKVWAADKQFRKQLIYDNFPARDIFIVKRNKHQNIYTLAVREYVSLEYNGTCFWYLPGYRFTSLKAAALSHRMLPPTLNAKTDLPHE
jgi:hypothetical protein